MKYRIFLTVLVAIGLATLLLLPRDLDAAEPIGFDDFSATCVQTILKDCKVLSAGYLNTEFGDEIGNPMLAWQTQFGVTDGDGLLGGVVLLQYLDETWSILGTGFDGVDYSPPTLNQDGLLHVAGYSAGTGAFNTDLVYQRDDAGTGWRNVDVDSWLATINDKLPAGLGIWKGVDYDFESVWKGYSASTPLWRSDDANCCATGGSAVITFAIDQDMLVVDKVHYTPPTKQN